LRKNRVLILFLTILLLAVLLSGCGENTPSAVSSTLTVKQTWQQTATDKIKGLIGEKCPGPRNSLITAAYAEMYLGTDGRIYKWSGLAAFASAIVGFGITQPASLSTVPDEQKTFQMLLAKGNLAVFTDLYWQHLAYRSGGLAALEKAAKEGDLVPELLEGWRKIDQGKRENKEDITWEGNAVLLRYEQEKILQPLIYDNNVELWGKLKLILSAAPNDRVDFKTFLPQGQIAKFEDRWKWISESMLPAWRKAESTERDAVDARLKAFAGVSPQIGVECK
jgi:hypothetical protein